MYSLHDGALSDPAALAVPGAYALLVDLPVPLTIEIRGAAHRLEAGRYIYCGSAYGPGGIRARVSRHLRQSKTVRWHIDRLTSVAPVIEVLAKPGGNECDFVREWHARGACFPIPGFGSTDCRQCTAHLLKLPSGVASSGDVAKMVGQR